MSLNRFIVLIPDVLRSLQRDTWKSTKSVVALLLCLVNTVKSLSEEIILRYVWLYYNITSSSVGSLQTVSCRSAVVAGSILYLNSQTQLSLIVITVIITHTACTDIYYRSHMLTDV